MVQNRGRGAARRPCRYQVGDLRGKAAGFVTNDLSPEGTVALIQADRPIYERVLGNDRNGSRRGCW